MLVGVLCSKIIRFCSSLVPPRVVAMLEVQPPTGLVRLAAIAFEECLRLDGGLTVELCSSVALVRSRICRTGGVSVPSCRDGPKRSEGDCVKLHRMVCGERRRWTAAASPLKWYRELDAALVGASNVGAATTLSISCLWSVIPPCAAGVDFFWKPGFQTSGR